MSRFEERLGDLLDTAAPASTGVPFEKVARGVRRRRSAQLTALGTALVSLGVAAGLLAPGVLGGQRVARLAASPGPGATNPSVSRLAALVRDVPCTPKSTKSTAAQITHFHPVTAMICHTEQRSYPGDGEWSVEIRLVATSGLPALEAAFGLPNEAFDPHACPNPPGVHSLTVQSGVIGENTVALINDSGQALWPAPPTGACGGFRPEYHEAFADVGWTQVSVRRVKQVLSPAAAAIGCPMRYKNENAIYAQVGTKFSNGGPAFPSQPAHLSVCIYAVTSDPEIGEFHRGFTLTAEETAQMLAAVQGPGHPGNCPAQPKFAVIGTGGNTPSVNVELGGCWRVERSYPAYRSGNADASAVQTMLDHHKTG